MYRSTLVELAPPADISLVSLDDVKDDLGLTDSSGDPRVSRWISRASAAIEAFIGRGLRSRDLRETFVSDVWAPRHWGWGRVHWDTNQPEASALALTNYPVTAITSLTCDDELLVEGTDFEVDASTGLLWRLNTCRVGWTGRRIVVDYTAGWVALTDVPSEVADACSMMIAYRQAARGRDPALRQVSIPGVMDKVYYSGSATSSGGPGNLPPEVAAAVQHLRDVRA